MISFDFDSGLTSGFGYQDSKTSKISSVLLNKHCFFCSVTSQPGRAKAIAAFTKVGKELGVIK